MIVARREHLPNAPQEFPLPSLPGEGQFSEVGGPCEAQLVGTMAGLP